MTNIVSLHRHRSIVHREEKVDVAEEFDVRSLDWVELRLPRARNEVGDDQECNELSFTTRGQDCACTLTLNPNPGL
eukprot:1045771-Rhodomonas_salina.1